MENVAAMLSQIEAESLAAREELENAMRAAAEAYQQLQGHLAMALPALQAAPQFAEPPVRLGRHPSIFMTSECFLDSFPIFKSSSS